jgi:hypothetical protein
MPARPRRANLHLMARDLNVVLDRCTYCSRPAARTWAEGLRTCRNEVCEGLAFAEAQRRARRAGRVTNRRPKRRLLHRR